MNNRTVDKVVLTLCFAVFATVALAFGFVGRNANVLVALGVIIIAFGEIHSDLNDPNAKRFSIKRACLLIGSALAAFSPLFVGK